MRAVLLSVLLTMLSLDVPPAHAQHNRHDPRVLREDPRLAVGQIAPVLEGLGHHSREITASSERAKQFFNQGLRLTYGFNHKEALRAFKEAVRLDPNCAMAYWGWALVLGPNLNLPMRPEVVSQAKEAIQQAVALKDKVTEVERDFIDALAMRYGEEGLDERADLDAAYALAMGLLHQKYAQDPDAGTLYAAALMNLSPWDYWTPDGRPKGRTNEILAVLESAIEHTPEHEGALHYYIHAVEAVNVERGIAAADTLRGRAPGAGHLIHMPSHIYMQVGRFAEAFEANVLAAKADEGYITQCQAQGIYPLNYYPHNVHFLVWAGMMQGRSAATLEASGRVASKVPADHRGNDWANYQTFLSMPLYTMVRFGMWDEILKAEEPAAELLYWKGISHYARGLAHSQLGNKKRAREELSALVAISADPATSGVLVSSSNAGTLLTIATEVLTGELAAAAGHYDQAISHLDRAVRLQDSLRYNEPPAWPYPVRHTLGAMLLDAGRANEAEVVYWQDLTKNRENGYSLFGLSQALRVQGKTAAAVDAFARFETAWSEADVKLISSRY